MSVHVGWEYIKRQELFSEGNCKMLRV